jgi:hypothetical protein
MLFSTKVWYNIFMEDNMKHNFELTGEEAWFLVHAIVVAVGEGLLGDELADVEARLRAIEKNPYKDEVRPQPKQISMEEFISGNETYTRTFSVTEKEAAELIEAIRQSPSKQFIRVGALAGGIAIVDVSAKTEKDADKIFSELVDWL